MVKMNWRRAQFYGRRTLDHRYENDVPDAAERWLRRAERRAAATAHHRYSVVVNNLLKQSRGNPRAPEVGLVAPHSFSSTVVRPPGKRNPT